MNRTLTTCIVVACFTLLIGCRGAEAPADKNMRLEIAKAMNRIRAGDRDAYSHLSDVVRRWGNRAIPVFTEYLRDKNSGVRRTAVSSLGDIGDPAAIPAIAGMLEDATGQGVDAAAFGSLFVFPKSSLLSHKEVLLDPLMAFVERWERESGQAAMLIGDLDGKSKLESLRGVIREANRIAAVGNGNKDYRYAMVPWIKDDVQKALFKLGDKDAERAVLASLEQLADKKRRVFGIKAIQYAGRKEYVKYLIPMLNDKRDAEIVMYIDAPSGATHVYDRVRDLAVNVIAKLCDLKLSFKPDPESRYSEAQIREVKSKLRSLAGI